jgi:RND family efflux transporter MFP subunit
MVTSVIVIALVVAGAGWAFRTLAARRRASARSPSGSLPPLVRAEVAHRGDYTETLRGFGRTHALTRTQVVAEAEGVVVEIAPGLQAGQPVAATPAPDAAPGDGAARLPVLVRIDDRDLTDELEQARAQARAADADVTRLESVRTNLRARLVAAGDELAAAERELHRIEPLVPGTLSRSALDAQRIQVAARQRTKLQLGSQARETTESLRAARAHAQALERGVALAERRKQRAVVRAPFAGRIEKRQVDLGQRVRVGDALFTIVDLSRVELPVALPAHNYPDVQVGAPVRLFLPEAREPLLETTVARVAPAINASERTFFAYAVVPGQPSHAPAPPGTHLVAEVRGRTWPGVVAVPRRAFLDDRVFVARPDPQHPDRARVEVRRPEVVRSLAGVALVRSGLKEGERFLVTNLESVAEGSHVRLAPEAK